MTRDREDSAIMLKPSRVLVLSGGGVKGAYQVGALQRLVHDEGVTYDGFCGISVGALNSSFLAMFERGKESLAIQGLTAFWGNLDNSKVFKQWCPFGKLEGLWKPSFTNSSPLQEMVRKNLDPMRLKMSGKILRVGAVSLKTGQYKLFGQNDVNIVEGVLASSAFPAYLCPVEIDGELYTDGGVKVVTPIKTAIELGATEIDIVMCSPPYADPKFPEKPNAIEVAMRSIDLMVDQLIEHDLKLAHAYNRLVEGNLAPGKRFITFRIFRPREILIEDSLDFSLEGIQRMMKMGYEETQWTKAPRWLG